MASASAFAMASPATAAAAFQRKEPLAAAAGLRPVSLSAGKSGPGRCLEVRASMKEKVVSVATAAVIAAALTVPEAAEAAGPGLSPSLKNFLLSIVAGGVVLTVIVGAVIGVSNFDPVKRG